MGEVSASALAAWWGAVLSTILLVLEIVKLAMAARADRPRVAVTILYGANREGTPLLTVRATNIGKRPVTLVEGAFEFPDRTLLHLPLAACKWDPAGLPRTLADGGTVLAIVWQQTLQDAESKAGAQARSIRFSDSLGRTFRERMPRDARPQVIVGGGI